MGPNTQRFWLADLKMGFLCFNVIRSKNCTLEVVYLVDTLW